MNKDDLLEIYRKNKERDASRIKQKKAFSIREWGGFASSIVALALSLFTFYVTNLRKVDDFRVSMHGVMIARNTGGDSFSFTSALNSTFINSGTRPIAIESVDLLIVQNAPLTGNNTTDCYNNPEILYVDFESIVLKPQDIAVRPLQKYKPKTGRIFSSDGSPILNFIDPKANVHPILICLSVTFLAPEHSQRTGLIVLLAEDWQATSRFTPSSLDILPYLKEPPYVLLKESSFSLFEK